MAVAFPTTPAPNQVVTDSVTNAAWRWDAPSQRWAPAATGATFVTPAELATALSDYLPLTGGTINPGPVLITDGALTSSLAARVLNTGPSGILYGNVRIPWVTTFNLTESATSPTGWQTTAGGASASVNLSPQPNFNTFRIQVGPILPAGTDIAANQTWFFNPSGSFDIPQNMFVRGSGITYVGNGGANTVGFTWVQQVAGGPWNLAFHIDGGGYNFLPTVGNITRLNLIGGTAGAGGAAIAAFDAPNAQYQFFADWASDMRIKENVVATKVDALAVLDKVKLKAFDFIKDKRHVPIGIVAQDIEDIIPEMVGKGADGDMRFLNQKMAVPYLIRAIQQLTARVKELEAGHG